MASTANPTCWPGRPFPHLAASKTYSSDAQITNSAPSAVAMTAGVKTINDVMGLDHTVDARQLRRPEDQGRHHAVGDGGDASACRPGGHHGDDSPTRRRAPPTPTSPTATGNPTRPCRPRRSRRAAPTSPASWSRCPTATGSRSRWAAAAATSCRTTAADPEDEGKKGKRKDGKDLTKAWLDRYGNSGAYVWNKEQFDAIDPANDRPPARSLRDVAHGVRVRPAEGQGRRAVARRDGREGDRHPVARTPRATCC